MAGSYPAYTPMNIPAFGGVNQLTISAGNVFDKAMQQAIDTTKTAEADIKNREALDKKANTQRLVDQIAALKSQEDVAQYESSINPAALAGRNLDSAAVRKAYEAQPQSILKQHQQDQNILLDQNRNLLQTAGNEVSQLSSLTDVVAQRRLLNAKEIPPVVKQKLLAQLASKEQALLGAAQQKAVLADTLRNSTEQKQYNSYAPMIYKAIESARNNGTAYNEDSIRAELQAAGVSATTQEKLLTLGRNNISQQSVQELVNRKQTEIDSEYTKNIVDTINNLDASLYEFLTTDDGAKRLAHETVRKAEAAGVPKKLISDAITKAYPRNLDGTTNYDTGALEETLNALLTAEGYKPMNWDLTAKELTKKLTLRKSAQ